MGTWEHVKLGTSLPWHNTLGRVLLARDGDPSKYTSIYEGR